MNLMVQGIAVPLLTRETFRIVGIELGLVERSTTVRHATPRCEKAQLTVKRLAALPVPASVAAQMWRSTVLAQALYGCEVRQLTTALLKPLCTQARSVVHKPPLALSIYGALGGDFGSSNGSFCGARSTLRNAVSPAALGGYPCQLAWLSGLPSPSTGCGW